jgi:nucleoside-diphosphate-sugar epimerase
MWFYRIDLFTVRGPSLSVNLGRLCAFYKSKMAAVLLTGAGSATGSAVQSHLKAAGLRVRCTDAATFLPDESTAKLVEGIEILVHLTSHCRTSTGPTDTAWLDNAVRDTYNLLRAAAEAGVRKVVLSSTLDLFLPYPSDSDCLQTGGDSWPSWKPLPSTEPAILGPHMAEFVAREFAHAQALRVTVVRLGHVLWDVRGDTERKNLAGSPLRFSTTMAEAVEALCAPVLASVQEVGSAPLPAQCVVCFHVLIPWWCYLPGGPNPPQLERRRAAGI